jgi:hypothetical protein
MNATANLSSSFVVDLTGETAIADLAAATNATNATHSQGVQQLPLYKEPTQAALTATSEQRTIVQHWRNPSRCAAVNISSAPFAAAARDVPAAYLPIITAVLEASAKRILKRAIESYNATPSTLSSTLFTTDAIMTEAVEGNSEWLGKEELTKAWEASATRARYVTDSRYTSSKEYRVAVNYYADLLLKLSGKTSSYKPSELDLIVAKLDDSDMTSEMGAFVLRRVEQLRNKPEKAADVNVDLL